MNKKQVINALCLFGIFLGGTCFGVGLGLCVSKETETSEERRERLVKEAKEKIHQFNIKELNIEHRHIVIPEDDFEDVELESSPINGIIGLYSGENTHPRVRVEHGGIAVSRLKDDGTVETTVELPFDEDETTFDEEMAEFDEDQPMTEGVRVEIGPDGEKLTYKMTEEGEFLVEDPYVISLIEYMNDMKSFDKNTLYYYEKDKVLTDDRDAVLVDYKYYVGPDAFSSFGENSEDPDIVYIRNLLLACDFEVIREHTSYQKAVLGCDDDQVMPAEVFIDPIDREE